MRTLWSELFVQLFQKLRAFSHSCNLFLAIVSYFQTILSSIHPRFFHSTFQARKNTNKIVWQSRKLLMSVSFFFLFALFGPEVWNLLNICLFLTFQISKDPQVFLNISKKHIENANISRVTRIWSISQKSFSNFCIRMFKVGQTPNSLTRNSRN